MAARREWWEGEKEKPPRAIPNLMLFKKFSEEASAEERSAVSPGVLWSHSSRGGRTGSARGLPARPPREERTKHETKPRRNLGNRVFFNNRVFVLLIAFVFVSISVYCLVLDHNTQVMVVEIFTKTQ